jgi:NADH-quinone oxidoreductase subunit K
MIFSLWNVVIFVILGLLGIGMYALLMARNLIKVIVGLQILVKAVMLALILAGNVKGQAVTGQSLAITVIVADTIVAVVGLALAVQVRQRCGTLDIQALSTLRR